MRDRITDKWTVTHLDCVDRCLDFMDLICTEPTEEWEVYVTGGMAGDASSLDISNTLISLMVHSNRRFYVQLFLTCALNTITAADGGPARPRVLGCCYSRSQSAVCPAYFPLDCRGPELILCSALCCLQPADAVMVVYCGDKAPRVVCIPPPSNISHDALTYFLSIPLSSSTDDDILSLTSSSPYCEPAHYASGMRDVIRLLAGYPVSVVDRFRSSNDGDDRPIRYTLCPDFKWLPLME